MKKLKFWVLFANNEYCTHNSCQPKYWEKITHPDILNELGGQKIDDNYWEYQIKSEWYPALFEDKKYEEYKRVFLYPRLLREKNSLPKHHGETALYKDKCEVICPRCWGEMEQGEPMTVRSERPDEQTVNTKTCSRCNFTECEQPTIKEKIS